MDDRRLFLLDAYALIYRAYYALIRSPRITSKGFNTSAIFGFCNTLDEILRKQNPTHIAVCFDPAGGKTFRHEMFPEYKAQREAQPEDITLSVPYIKEILAAYRIPVVEVAGYEADDVIGTISRQAERHGLTTYMMTPDKDYGQLVTDHVLMYRPPLGGKDFEIRGPKEVCERYGISSPIQVIDLLALEGDASDNIPGCPGVGEKTAVKLISQFGSVENLIAHASEVKGALGKKISDNIAQIELSKDLATIRTDIPLEVDFKDFERSEPDVEALRDIYRRLEFRMFINRLDPAPAQLDVTPVASQTPPSLFDDIDTQAPVQTPVLEQEPVEILTTPETVSGFITEALATDGIAISLYAPGSDAMTVSLQGIAIYACQKAVYIPLSDSDARSNLLPLLQPLFSAQTSTRIISNELKRDMVVLRNNGIYFSAPFYDTAVAHYLLRPQGSHRLSDIVAECLSQQLPTPATSRNPYPEYPADSVASHMALSARLTYDLYPILNERIAAEGHQKLLDEIELPLIPVLADMEFTGVKIDTDELSRLSISLTERMELMQQQVYNLAGKEFNIGSPRQVGEILFHDLAIDPKAKRTKTGAYSTTEEILESYRAEYPIVDLILRIRALSKLLATYVNALPQLINPRTGKIHTTFNQTVTATGRLSSSNPNLQNIPVRSDDGKDIRRAFIPDSGHLLLSADYSQIELRLMADLSADTQMVEAFASGEDIHRSTAAKIYHIPLNEVTDTQRRNAKTANFGIIYGISPFGLSQRLGIPRGEAKELIEQYFQAYPGVKDYINSNIEKARSQGYISTITGRRRDLPEITSRNASLRSFAERNAVNAPLQGSAADIIKIAMIAIHRRMEELGMRSKMILQVHDELIFDVVPEELPQLQQLVAELMQDAYHGKVKLEVSSGVATNWLEAH